MESSSSNNNELEEKLLVSRDRVFQGLKLDYECLLKKFSERGSLEFPAFASIWKSMKMSMISAGRVYEREARQFTEECLLVIVTYFHPQQKFETLVGAFYILYSLYVTQPVKPECKIRFTIKNWTTINSFIQEAIARQLQDVEFIFHKLCALKAFLYVAPPNEIISDLDPVDDDDIYLKQLFSRQTSALETIFTNDNVDQLSAIHDQYQEMKRNLSGVERTEIPDPSVNMLEVNTATVIADVLQSLKNDPDCSTKKTQRKTKEVEVQTNNAAENPKVSSAETPKSEDETADESLVIVESSNEDEDNPDAYDVADENDENLSDSENDDDNDDDDTTDIEQEMDDE